MNEEVTGPTPVYTDTHAHLDLPVFNNAVDGVIGNARSCGVHGIVCVGTTLDASRACLELAERFPSTVTASAGIHPNYCSSKAYQDFNILRDLAAEASIRAIGETGLDYHHNAASRSLQKEFFLNHIDLALRVNKPLIVHGRKADEDILKILDDCKKNVRGIRHCFDSSAQIAKEYVKRGFFIAFGGLITKDGHNKLKQAAVEVPDENLLLETDSPYMKPKGAPLNRNEPASISFTARALAELRKVTVEHIAAVTTENASQLGLTPVREQNPDF